MPPIEPSCLGIIIECLAEEDLTLGWTLTWSGNFFGVRSPTHESLRCTIQGDFLLCTHRTPTNQNDGWPETCLATSTQEALKWFRQKIANIPS